MDLNKKVEALDIVRAKLEMYPVAIGDVGFPVASDVRELHELEDYLVEHLDLPPAAISIGRKAIDDTSTTATYVIDSRP